MPKADSRLRYYAYISRAKVTQLYEQLHSEDVVRKVQKRGNEVKGDVGASVAALFNMIKGDVKVGGRRNFDLEEETTKTTVQKLGDVLEHIEKYEVVASLNELCRKNAGTSLNAFAYTYVGKFRSGGSIDNRSGEIYRYNSRRTAPPSGEYATLTEVALEENSFREIGPNGGNVVSDICLVSSKCDEFSIELACSLKYFSDMGGSWSEAENEWSVRPHSGNHHFFNGGYETFFEGLIFITGVKDRKILGSPLFLMMQNDPNLTI